MVLAPDIKLQLNSENINYDASIQNQIHIQKISLNKFRCNIEIINHLKSKEN